MAETKHLTIMFTDIKGFTKSTSIKKRDDLEKFLDLHEKLVRPTFKEFHGRGVKTIGDAFMVAFNSPTNAVLCGMKIQDVLKDYNQNPKNEEKVEVRVAINSGEVHIRGHDVFGEAVNIAARIEGIAEANEIYFTESVYLAMNKSEIPSAEVGYRKLKGVPEEIKVYKVLKEGKHANKFYAKRARLLEDSGQRLGFFGWIKSFWKRRKKWIIAFIIILFLIGLANNPQNIIKKESNINKFIEDAENAIASGNYQKAKELINKLEQIPREDLPPRLALEGAKLYVFMRKIPNAENMLNIARENYPNEEEMRMIEEFERESIGGLPEEFLESIN